jgi:hypothetical protein
MMECSAKNDEMALFEVGNQGHGAGFRGGFCPGIAVLGEFFRKVKEAPALPFDADAFGQSAGVVKGYPEGF